MNDNIQLLEIWEVWLRRDHVSGSCRIVGEQQSGQRKKSLSI